MSRKYAILTCSDSRTGDFLVNHWYRSLIENVDTTDIDVVVFDYGLSKKQKQQIQSKGACCIECKSDEGLVVNLRFRDFAHFLKNSDYSQAASFDGGDIIFQSDISHLFHENSQHYRCVCEDRFASFLGLMMKGADFSENNWRSLTNFLKYRQLVSSGVIAPVEKLIDIWKCFESLCTNLNEYGTDLVVINYVLHSKGFVPLNSRYNYMLANIHDRYRIRESRFFDSQGKLIPVVHNAGGKAMHRPIVNFGYGTNFNTERRWLWPFLFKTWAPLKHWLYESFRIWNHKSITNSVNDDIPFDTP